MNKLLNAGFVEVQFPEFLSLCPSILEANTKLNTAGTASCPFWGIIPFVLRAVRGGDSSWMANDYGYARCFRSPDSLFLAFVYEDEGEVSMSFVLSLTNDSCAFNRTVAQCLPLLSPVLDFKLDRALDVANHARYQSLALGSKHDFKEIYKRAHLMSAKDLTDLGSVTSRFLTRDYYYNTKQLSFMAEEFVKQGIKVKSLDPALDQRLAHGWRMARTVRSYVKNQGCTVHPLESNHTVFDEISALVQAWRLPKLVSGERMIFIDEYEYAFHPETLQALNVAGVPWSAHIMRDKTGRLVAVSIGVATNETDWCCIFRVDAAGLHHASEVPWLLDASKFYGMKYVKAFDGGGSETVGYTGLSELKERYVSWTEGGADTLYAVCMSAHAGRFDHNQTMLQQHDALLAVKGIQPSIC